MEAVTCLLRAKLGCTSTLCQLLEKTGFRCTVKGNFFPVFLPVYRKKHIICCRYYDSKIAGKVKLARNLLWLNLAHLWPESIVLPRSGLELW